MKRLMIGLAAGALLAAMLPGVASAGGPKDMVNGSATFAADRSHVTVHAQSDANGANARGTYRIHVGDLPYGGGELDLVADVVCLDVAGDVARVGVVVTASSNKTFPVGLEMAHYVVDNGPPGRPDASLTWFPVPAAQCETFSPPVTPPDVETGNWVVKDRD